jgi:CRISPR/Cas system-associated endonuclease/helicase Cas3
MKKNYYVVEGANLLAFESYEEACAYCYYFDDLCTPRVFKRENIEEYNEEYKNALIMTYNNNKLLQIGYTPLSLL